MLKFRLRRSRAPLVPINFVDCPFPYKPIPKVSKVCRSPTKQKPTAFGRLKKPPQIVDMNGNDTFLDVNDAHLRVMSGNVYASAFNLDQIEIVASANTVSTVNFNNDTKAFNAASNIEVGTANLFVDTTTSNVGIGTNTPLDTLHINGGTRFAGHIIPTTNATFDIGSAENKVRDLYVDTNSIWVGDRAKIAFENGKMKFKRRKLNKVPRMLVTLAISGGRTDEADVETHAIAFAQTKDASISSVSDLKLEHLRDYAKTFDNTKSVSDIFADNEEDYEAITASEAFMEVGSNIFTEHSLSIGKTTDPTSALDVEGDVVIQPESQSVTFADVYNRTYYGFSDSLGFSFSTPSRPYGSAATAIYSKRVKYTSTGGLKVSPPDTGNQVYYNLAASIGYYVNFLIGYKWDAVLGTGSVASPYLSGDVFSSTRFKNYDQEDFTGFAIGQVYTPGNVTSDLYQPVPKLARYHSAHMYFKTASSNGTLTEKMRITNAGNVGIGTTSPTAALDVSGTVKATAFEGDGSALTGITSGQWTESSGDIYRSSGNVGVGTTSPDYKLHAYTNTTGSNLMELEHDGTTTSGGPNGTNYWMQFRYGGRVGMTIKAPDNSVNTPVTFASNNALKFMVDATEPLTLDHLGNVGINKALPDRNFHVVGTSRFEGDVEWYKVGERTSHANLGTNRDWYIRSGSTAGKVIIQDGGGSVGIGTSNPESILHVQHTTTNNAFIKASRHNETSSTKPIFAVSEYQMTGETSPGTIIGNHNRSIHIGPVFEAGNTVDSTDIRGIHIKSTGDVGIGTTSPSTELQIGNTSTKTSDTYLTIASDGGNAYAQGIRLIHHGTDDSNMYGWRIRGDDSDDCFHINYINAGSHQTSALKIQRTNGILTTPSRPAFYAWDNSTSRSGTTLTFDSTTYNIGSHYNTSTSRFKTPVAGTYIFAAVLAHDTANEFGAAYFSFYVDGAAKRDILEGMPIHDSHYESHAVYIVNLAANQYVDIRSRSNTNITFINGHHGAYYRNCFQGALLG